MKLYITMSWIYNILLVGSLGYVVFILGFSGWWFLLAPIFWSQTAKGASQIALAHQGKQWTEDDA